MTSWSNVTRDDIDHERESWQLAPKTTRPCTTNDNSHLLRATRPNTLTFRPIYFKIFSVFHYVRRISRFIFRYLKFCVHSNIENTCKLLLILSCEFFLVLSTLCELARQAKYTFMHIEGREITWQLIIL